MNRNKRYEKNKRNKDSLESMIRLMEDLQLYGSLLEEYKEKHHIYYNDPNDYGDKIKPILKSTHIAYVCSNENYDERLNVNKLKYEYNSININYAEQMFYNFDDIIRQHVIYPYSFRELVNFFKKRNIKAEVYLIITKYHYWDEIECQELFQEYEEKKFKKIQRYSYLPSNLINSIVEEIPIGDLKEYMPIPILQAYTCRIFFIVIKASNGLTCATELFSPHYMPTIYKENEKLKLSIINKIHNNYDINDDDVIDNDNNNDNIDNYNIKEENNNEENNKESISNNGNQPKNKNSKRNIKKIIPSFNVYFSTFN
ncbi:hypothetical protein BCR36DRAFT_413683 [Piromyces finnis]|uniref:Uncharacterized protein n=1 Tax=Piromyces finnis TaxID=1754191 RepID=A0A1Y1V5N0_9FUNG|nr:hypothetical protein BCR36DRAFT_413683 [Piromyces finnis]|eukprot:ORX47331.1 hypothetical protein BCR36DRAFT_413683 [Piromyces finnis]